MAHSLKRPVWQKATISAQCDLSSESRIFFPNLFPDLFSSSVIFMWKLNTPHYLPYFTLRFVDAEAETQRNLHTFAPTPLKSSN